MSNRKNKFFPSVVPPETAEAVSVLAEGRVAKFLQERSRADTLLVVLVHFTTLLRNVHEELDSPDSQNVLFRSELDMLNNLLDGPITQVKHKLEGDLIKINASLMGSMTNG